MEACPPSALYRFRKFVRRNRVSLGLAATIATACVLVCLALVVAHRKRLETWQARLDLQAAEAARLEAEKDREAARLDALVQEGLRLSGGLHPDFAAAVENLTQVLRSRPNDADAYLYRGSIYYRWGRAEEARQDLQQALALRPENNLAAHQLLAIVAQQLGKNEEAAQHLALAQAANPDTVEAVTTQAIALNNRQGLELLTKAIEEQPFDPLLYRYRGQLAFNIVFQEDAAKDILLLAVSDLEKAFKAFPADRSILTRLGFLLTCKSNEIPELDCAARCKKLVDTWLADSPNDEDALMLLILYHGLLRNDIEQAMHVGLDAQELHPESSAIVQQMGEMCFVAGKFDQAERLFTRELELTHDANQTDYAYMRRGDCRAILGKREAARSDLEKVRQTTPRSEWWGFYWSFLIFGYRQLGDVEAAETLTRQWAAQCPKAPRSASVAQPKSTRNSNAGMTPYGKRRPPLISIRKQP